MLKKIFILISNLSGLPFLFRKIKGKNKVRVLFYHDPKPELFEKHLLLIMKKYHIIPLNQYVEGQCDLPPYPVIITFDDGHAGNYKLFPVLKKYGVPVTIFLAMNIIGTNRRLWYSGLDTMKKETLKQKPDEERLSELSAMGYDDSLEFESGDGLSKEQISEMKEIVDFQSHTITHPILPRCSNTKSKHEIMQSKKNVEALTEQECYAIAFPNGDYTEREIEFAKLSGYKTVLSCDFGFNPSHTPPFHVKRISIPDNCSVSELPLRVSGLWGALKSI